MSYLCIKNDYKLREEEHKAILFNSNIEKMLNNYHYIPKSHFGILQLMNGQYNKDDLINLYSDAISVNKIESTNIINYIIDKYRDYIEFIGEKSVRNDLVVIRVEEIASIRKYKSEHRLLSPLLLSLVLTYNCNCYCRYCFVNAKHCDNTNNLDTDQFIEVIKQAKQIGVAGINLTGGDPFVRNDIYEILEGCLKEKLSLNISTKERLSVDNILKLKNIGLKSIQVSLDSNDDKISENLVCVKSFSTEMMKTIQNLIANDIDVKVNTVVTKANIQNIPNLIKTLDSYGVSKHYLSPYLKTLGRHDNNLFPDYKEYNQLDSYLQNYKGNMFIDYKNPCNEINGEKNLDDIQYCTGGRMGIVINPNGDVTICERMIENDECIVGNVKNSTLQNIWDSIELYNLIEPNKEKFINTSCYECNEYDNCILDKGLCYARCKIAYGNIFNKDPLCPNETKEFRFV